MPIKLIAAIEKDFILARADSTYGKVGEEPTKIRIKQAKQGEKEARDAYFAELTRVSSGYFDPEIKIRQKVSFEELKRLEISLTLIDCNIMGEDGKPLFTFKRNSEGKQYLDMNVNDFLIRFSALPPDVVDEIHEKVLEVNPSWGGTQGEK